MGVNKLCNWKLTVLKTIKKMLLRPPMVSVKPIVRADCAVSACSTFLLSIKALAPLTVSDGRVGSAFDKGPPSHCPQLASIWYKANFPFHQPGLFIGFPVASSQTPPFGNNTFMWPDLAVSKQGRPAPRKDGVITTYDTDFCAELFKRFSPIYHLISFSIQTRERHIKIPVP